MMFGKFAEVYKHRHVLAKGLALSSTIRLPADTIDPAIWRSADRPDQRWATSMVSGCVGFIVVLHLDVRAISVRQGPFRRAKFQFSSKVAVTLPRIDQRARPCRGRTLSVRRGFPDQWPHVWHAIGWSTNNHDAKRNNGAEALHGGYGMANQGGDQVVGRFSSSSTRTC